MSKPFAKCTESTKEIIFTIVNLYYPNIEINAIIIVGSNYLIKNLKNSHNKNSDIDIIILSESLLGSKQFNYEYEDTNLDIIITNPNKILTLTLEAFNGSKQVGKIFSSSILHSIIYDEREIGTNFIFTLQKIYALFTKSCLPKFYANSLFLHNIKTNLSDLYKDTPIENFFSLQRISSQLFDYIATLIYPFKTSGSYRGKIFSQNFPNEFNNCLTPNNNNVNNYIDFIKSSVSKFAPVSKTKFHSFLYSDELQKELKTNQNIDSFFFGYDNLVFEKEIIFLTKENIPKIHTELTPLKLTNIIPFLSDNELNTHYDFLNYLSKKYIFSSLEERKKVMDQILNQFLDTTHKTTIENSLKAISLLKVIIDISKDTEIIKIKKFKSWLDTFNLQLKKKENTKINQSLSPIFSIIKNSSSIKEKEIKTNFIFFSILKSLRIKIEDIDFS
ncbi:hypothetical protein [Tenacibaculum ovolyticum]|uniref:hypothetical protein n=1 Tax=Tenacibaculum ovolyticum TaxID=104270 RepID=UPI0007EDEAA3|nr:hypothetical protein [Tenacibaculum ovolyticum]